VKIEYGTVKGFTVRRLWPRWVVVKVVDYPHGEQRELVVDRFWGWTKAMNKANQLNYGHQAYDLR
jgi:hypothetical protein